MAYATVDESGNLIAARSKGITQVNIDPDTQPGLVCFTDLPFTPRSAMVAAQSVFDGAQEDVIATSFISPIAVTTGDCSGKVEVRTFDISSNARADRAFHIWFED